MKNRVYISVAAVAASVGLVATSPAAPAPGSHSVGVAEHGVGHPHHVALFFGATSTGDGKHGPTIGADYGYRIHEYFSVAASVDYAGGDIDATILAAGAFVHATEELKLLFAPGVDHHHGEDSFVVRCGAVYDFHVGSLSVSPTVHVDLLEVKENIIYGLSVGYGF